MSSTNTTASRTLGVTARANEILARSGIMGNAYFRDLQSGAMSLDGFRRTQEQFFFAVTFFPRPMAALVGRIPDPRQRLDVLHNLVEEHGEFNEQQFHHNTFQQFLRTLGSDPARLDDLMIWPEVRAFNSVLTTACVLDELEVGVACMGVIEQAFAGISALIGRAVVDRGWVKPDELVHYKLHAEIDERHAEEFFAVVEAGWQDGSRRYFVEQGLELGTYIFDRLYRDLHAAAARSQQYHARPHSTNGGNPVLRCDR
jgi:pyrroloquinoline-quinone synthase